MAMALNGYATRYNKIVSHNGKNMLLLPDVFAPTLNYFGTVRLLLDHSDDYCLGSTLDILELHSDQYGLGFRARLPDTPLGDRAREMAESKEYNCMSLWFDYNDATKDVRKIDDKDVVVISSATLSEISFLSGYNGGVVKDAFAQYTEVDFSKSLRSECRSLKYLNDNAAMNVRRAIRNLEYW
jgi:HK97 family phage prohead protease